MEWDDTEIQRATWKRLLTSRNLFGKIKRKEKRKGKKTSNTTSDAIFLAVQDFNRVETNIAWYLDPAKYFLLTNYPHATKQKSPPTEVCRLSTLSTGFSSSTTIRNSKAGNFSRARGTRASRGL